MVASKTGPSTQTCRYLSKPFLLLTAQPRQAPIPQAIIVSIDTWHGTAYLSAIRATEPSIAKGPHAQMISGGFSFVAVSSRSVTSPFFPKLPSSVEILIVMPSYEKSSKHSMSCFDLPPVNSLHVEGSAIFARSDEAKKNRGATPIPPDTMNIR